MDNVKTKAIVLRRTNYGEADRILNILTPMGKMSVMAKGVRKTQSKLAGGIELFCVSDVVVHRGKGDLGVLTSARLVEFYSEIMKDLAAMEFMGGSHHRH
jgi:DNA repair protein RecO (recombination protein O)